MMLSDMHLAHTGQPEFVSKCHSTTKELEISRSNEKTVLRSRFLLQLGLLSLDKLNSAELPSFYVYHGSRFDSDFQLTNRYGLESSL